MIAKTWDNVREETIFWCFKEAGFDWNIDLKIIIENDSDLAALLLENNQFENYTNFDKDLDLC